MSEPATNAAENAEPSEKAEDAGYPPDIATALRGSRLDRIAGAEEITVRVFGEEAGAVPVIMVHGLQSHSVWFAQSARLIASTGRPVYAMDRRGSGLSRGRRGDCRDFREMVEDIRLTAERAVERRAAGKVHVLGHCFGSVPAAAFACAYPALVGSLVLPTPGFYTRATLGFMSRMRVLLSLVTGGTARVPLPLETEMFTDLEPYRAFIRADVLSLKDATARFILQVRRARAFVEKNAHCLVMPVFMALAGGDRICDNVRNRIFFEGLLSRHKRLKIYRGARHILEYSGEREKFFGDLCEWFDGSLDGDDATHRKI